MASKKYKELRIVLGDQINYGHSWLDSADDEVLYLLAEIRSETDYVKHHIQKILCFFGAMREFAKELKEKGHNVEYIELSENKHKTFKDLVLSKAKEYGVEKFSYRLPDEYRLDVEFKGLSEQLVAKGIEVEAFDTEHFIAERSDLANHFKGKKTFVMESFYREMRKKHSILMDGSGEPEGGQWNYDAMNRKKLPKSISLPDYFDCQNDLSGIKEMIDKEGVEYFGNVDASKVHWPLNKVQAEEVLDYFVQNLLSKFGDYQDAMTSRDWSLFHSRLSFAMNIKLISPMEVVKAIEKAYYDDPDKYPLHCVEGFIRQIIGWREYMRGIYWAKMPEFSEMNELEAKRSLPSWYWTGETKMKCLSHSINQSLNHAYAHHIQRLMVTGNFAMLAGLHPDEVDEWYLGIYIDAIEWVEITNTRGMSQYADGGIVGTKPYGSSANYINKMSDYCGDCHYSQTKKTGDKACPFNSLYWNFFNRNRKKLEGNPRIGMAYRNIDRMDSAKIEALETQAEEYLADIENL
ncbi:MAG: cryptochrome/photolyase family protein [Candidatus Kapaibacteriales bacterium]